MIVNEDFLRYANNFYLWNYLEQKRQECENKCEDKNYYLKYYKELLKYRNELGQPHNSFKVGDRVTVSIVDILGIPRYENDSYFNKRSDKWRMWNETDFYNTDGKRYEGTIIDFYYSNEYTYTRLNCFRNRTNRNYFTNAYCYREVRENEIGSDKLNSPYSYDNGFHGLIQMCLVSFDDEDFFDTWVHSTTLSLISHI